MHKQIRSANQPFKPPVFPNYNTSLSALVAAKNGQLTAAQSGADLERLAFLVSRSVSVAHSTPDYMQMWSGVSDIKRIRS